MAPTNQSQTFDIGGELTVHRLGYGAMRVTGDDIIGPPPDGPAAREVLKHALDCNIDFVDTADSYGPGVSERLLRETGVTEEAVVATKAGLLRWIDGEWIAHGEPDYIKNQALVSRDRLGVDSIDLYQFHRPDPDTPFEDSIHAFAELKDAGIVEHIGLSNVSVDQLDRARDIVEIATVQNQYNLTNRSDEDVLHACENDGIGFIPWFPLAAGDLDDRRTDLAEIAAAHDATRQQVAIAWLLRHSDVTLPIPGTSTIAHLEENVAASQIELTEEEYDRLT